MNTARNLHTYLILVLVKLALVVGLIGCSSTEPAAEDNGQVPEYDVEQQDTAELEALYWSRVDDSRMNFTQADVDFMTGMIVHHAQALIMSRLAPENDASPTVQILAARIINAQQDEIDTMQKWLRDRGQPVPEIHIDGLDLMVQMADPETGDVLHGEHEEHGRDYDARHTDGKDHHGRHGEHAMHDHHDMPGMLTQEQLEELAAAKGIDFDRKFLDFMIEHHWGAVIMVHELFSVDGAALDREAFDLASGIKAEQITEIERMEQMHYSIVGY